MRGRRSVEEEFGERDGDVVEWNARRRTIGCRPVGILECLQRAPHGRWNADVDAIPVAKRDDADRGQWVRSGVLAEEERIAGVHLDETVALNARVRREVYGRELVERGAGFSDAHLGRMNVREQNSNTKRTSQTTAG